MKRTLNLFSLAMVLALIASLLGMPPLPAYAESTLEHVPLSLPAGWRDGHLYDVWGSSYQDVYAVGNAVNAAGDHVPLLYHNDGTGWIEASPPLATGWGGGHLYGVWGSSASDVYATGTGTNVPLVYHRDGTGWADASLSLPVGWSYSNLRSVWGSSASNVYTVGWGSNGPLLYQNDGTGWSEASSSLPAGGGSLYGIWGSSAGDIYAVGYGDNAVGDTSPLVYHSDGTGWTGASPSLPPGWSAGYLHGVWGSSAGDLYMVGEGSYVFNNGTMPLLYQRGADNETTLVRYVKWDASGANNGTSWADAYTDLQSALTAASSGDEIWVAAGTYKPTTGNNRTISFALKNGVAIYGGFASTETLRTQRDLAVNVTVLSGDIGVVGNNSDNSYHVVVGTATDNSTLLDGFTITAGNANLSQLDTGGGMLNERGSPVVSNVIFSGNSAGLGGGMYNSGDMGNPASIQSHPILTNVIFKDNSALEGGGMENQFSSSPTLTNVIFINNTAIRSGGGLINYYYSSPTLTNVTFNGNTASAGGGIMNWVGNNPTLTNVTFHNNSATLDGGGGVANYQSSPILTNVTFSNNSAAKYGGGMFNDNNGSPSNPILKNVTRIMIPAHKNILDLHRQC